MKAFVLALALSSIADAISYMVVGPSIVFYVMESCGGSKSQYGIILSAYSFASFCCKPFLGAWSDTHGFRRPYIWSFSISALGGLAYLMASSLAVNDRTDYDRNNSDVWNRAVMMVLLARLLGGVGAANSTLGYGYIAQVLPHKEQTKTNALLSMTRLVGMALGPSLNYFLTYVDVQIFPFLHLDALNSVGLVLIASNLLAMTFIYLYLPDPTRTNDEETKNKDVKKQSQEKEEDHQNSNVKDLMRAVLSADILIYMLSIFSFNASFQLIETAFAPAVNHALGWGSVQISAVMGLMSVGIFVNMFLVFRLSSSKIGDESLLSFGLILGMFGYGWIYFSWKQDATMWYFILPMTLGICSFPYLGAPTRSLFTQVVDSKPILDPHHGKMQALLSMAASVAGFVSPGLIATFVLRHPNEVESSSDGRELNAGALFAPILSILTLLGHIYVQKFYNNHPSTSEEEETTIEAAVAGEHHDMEKNEDMSPQMPPLNETTSLLTSKSNSTKNRRSSTSDIKEVITGDGHYHKRCKIPSTSRRASLPIMDGKKIRNKRPLFCNSFMGDVTFHHDDK